MSTATLPADSLGKLLPRFRRKIDVTDLHAHHFGHEPASGCWIWSAGLSHNGYGLFFTDGQMRYAHRIAYEIIVGSIPEGLDLDHLCRNRACVNPLHLIPATRRENLLRGETVTASNAAKTHCPKGHPYDETNTFIARKGSRVCLACRRDFDRRRSPRRKDV